MKISIFAFLAMLTIAPIAKAESNRNFNSELILTENPIKDKELKTTTTTVEKSSNEVEAVVEEAKNRITGIVSWYADKFHGKKTSSGEVYDKKELTAAHRTLPFGTKVKVTNVKNGKSVIVKINDRGPHTKSRVLDLSRAAFEEIGSVNSGTLNIEMEVVK
ncbi:septal ring lytic transglycosylase RlpA family protein [Faecalibacter sp. LW9]|uniref:septal ring lytic transglycosylase RlpA family protein n=1 Tax=Faecalibacter sp. LW9 TaxID=3103144 RepID=UPI002AFEBF27|nr:septal ring lytic transglycosylase RlpA family protein [Faecalibacter sp. LW9]